MLGNTNNYNNLMGSLSRLNNNLANFKNEQQSAQNTSGASSFSNNVNNAGSGFMSSFDGFQQQLGQRYSMSNNQTMQLLQMFSDVLEELLGDVVNNSNNSGSNKSGGNEAQSGKGGRDTDSVKQGGQQQSVQADSGNTTIADRTDTRAGRQSAKAERQEARAERQAANGVDSNSGPGGGVWQNTAGRSDSTNSVAPTQSVESPDSTSAASGSEASQAHKSGGCPFMAMESEQSSSGNANAGDQSTNTNASSAAVPAGHPNTKPAEVVAGPAGNQGNPSVSGSNGSTPVKPAEPAKPTAGGVENNQPTQSPANTGNVDQADNRDIDFSTLNKAERSDIGLDTRERAVIHLWGRQMMSAGEQNGGIYTNVLGADGTGSNWGNKDEVALVQELRAQENEKFGTDTGWLLDEAYFEIMKDKTGVDMSARYADRPVNESKGPVVISNDIDAVAERTGISGFEQGVMRLMGHDALMDGEFDGSVLEYTVGNANSLDSNKHSGGNAIDDMAQTLLAQDKADDGEVNGSSIMAETVKTLDRLYA